MLDGAQMFANSADGELEFDGTLEYLRSVGCDLEPRCQSGETPLVKAARAQAMRAYKFLLEHGTPHAEIEHRNREDDNARQLIIDNTRHWHISGGASVEYTK